MALAILADDGFRLGVGQVPDALLRFQMKFDPETLALGADEAERVATEAMHVAVGRGNTAVAHHDSDLMQRLGQ